MSNSVTELHNAALHAIPFHSQAGVSELQLWCCGCIPLMSHSSPISCGRFEPETLAARDLCLTESIVKFYEMEKNDCPKKHIESCYLKRLFYKIFFVA